MSKQTPMLMESPLTKRVFVVTSYKDKGDGIFEARQKYDVTEQFDALAEQRSGTCELREASWDDGTCTWGVICSACGEKHEHTHGCGWNFAPCCGRRVER